MDSAIIRKLITIKQLPTLPVMMTRILKCVENANSSASDVGDIVSNDPSISSKILRFANSAFYGRSSQVDTIQEAIVIIGFNTVKQLALATSMFESFSGVKSQRTFDRLEFWKHSMGTAMATSMLFGKASKSETDRIYTAGLLHDIGKLVMDIYFHKDYIAAVEKAACESLFISQAERYVFKSDHGEIGAWLAERWHFPDSLKVPMQFHHNVDEADIDHKRTTMMIHVADFVSRSAEVGLCNSQKPPVLEEELLSLVNLKSSDILKAIKKMKKKEDEIDAFLKAIK
jgi:putative nucleotidyltransferase with HDIG domain